jgi:hypothetical protein
MKQTWGLHLQRLVHCVTDGVHFIREGQPLMVISSAHMVEMNIMATSMPNSTEREGTPLAVVFPW